MRLLFAFTLIVHFKLPMSGNSHRSETICFTYSRDSINLSKLVLISHPREYIVAGVDSVLPGMELKKRSGAWIKEYESKIKKLNWAS